MVTVTDELWDRWSIRECDDEPPEFTPAEVEALVARERQELKTAKTLADIFYEKAFHGALDSPPDEDALTEAQKAALLAMLTKRILEDMRDRGEWPTIEEQREMFPIQWYQKVMNL